MRMPTTLLAALVLTACGQAAPPPSASAPAAPAAADAPAALPLDPGQARFGVTPLGASPTPAPASPAPSPAPSAAPSAAPPPPSPPPPLAVVAAPWDPAHAGAQMVAFASTRFPSGLGGFDVYLYDAPSGTVYAIPAANTPGAEIHPRLSSNGRWLVFATNYAGNFDIVRYDLQTQIMDPLPQINTPDNQLSPAIDDSGNVIAYLTEAAGVTQIRVCDLRTGVAAVPAPIAALPAIPHSPMVSGDGHWLAFAATDQRGSDVYVYQLGSASVSNPPFINTPADEVDPWLSPDGQRMLFASNRAGSFDLYEADLVSGFTHNLTLASSAGNERQPRYMGPLGQDVLFESDRDLSENRIMLFHPATGIVDTLPLLHEAGEDDILGNGFVAPPSVDGPADDGFFGFGDLHRGGGTFGGFPGGRRL